MKNYYIGKSKIHGQGTIANKNFKEGDIIGIGLLQIRNTGIPFKDLNRTNLGRYINHSNLGNSELEKHGKLIMLKAIKDIKKDEEITLDYGKGLAYEISGGFREKDLNKY